jgi:branched-chain amino acid transport system ATP-binding protein
VTWIFAVRFLKVSLIGRFDLLCRPSRSGLACIRGLPLYRLHDGGLLLDQLTPVSAATPQSEAGSLSAAGVCVRFQGLSALTDVTLSLRRAEVLGLIGPNGAGKTTLVNCLTGFQQPTVGKVSLGDLDTEGWPPARFRKSGIARTFQAGRLFKEMTVLENVEAAAVALGLRRAPATTHAMAVLEWMGVAGRAQLRAGTLAYTDERRVGIARALVLSPAFILLDEPAAGMSDVECDELMEAVAKIPKTFVCGVLLIEHNVRIIMGVCDRLHVLDGGKTIAEGSPEAIQRDAAVIAAYLGEG